MHDFARKVLAWTGAGVMAALPGPDGVGSRNVKGRDSTSALSPSWLTALSDAASARNNEFAPEGA